jgi:MinD superfamily P-loop ATPase
VAWDNRIEKVKDSVLVSDAKKWEKRRIASIVKNWHSVKSLRKKVEEMLKFPVYETRESRDGQIVVTKPLKWGISDVAAMLKTVIELETAIFEAVCNRPDNEITEGEKSAIAEVQFEKELKKIEDAISRETTDHASDDATANDSPHGEQVPGGAEGETGGAGVEPES